MNAIVGYGLCALATLVVIAGDYFIKLAVDRGHTLASRTLMAGGLLYGLSAIGWFYALRKVSLSQSGVAFAMISLLALVALGVLVFEERLTLREWIGVGCAVASLILMARFI